MAEITIEERLGRVEATLDGMSAKLRSIDTRLLSLENWMRSFMVSMALVAIGVAVQITLTLLRTPIPK